MIDPKPTADPDAKAIEAAPDYNDPTSDPDPEAIDDDVYEERGSGWRALSLTLLAAGLIFGGWWGVRTALERGWLQELRRSYSEVSLLPGPLVRPSEPDLEIQIYYAAGDRGLDYRTYKLHRSPSGDAERVDLIRQALANPSDPEHFHSPLPGKTSIRAVYILDGIVWVDLSKEFRQAANPSPLAERLSVYALVNTFLLNVPDLQGVRILIEGQPADTAWGWLDLSTPLGINLSLIG